jgi:hypothetical protein
VGRIFMSGFEIASNTAGHEWANAGVSGAARSTGNMRTGSACGQVTGLVSATQAGWGSSFVSVADGGPYYLRTYLRVDTAPSADNCIIALVTGANVTSTSTNDAQIRLTSSRTLRLFAANAAVGSASAALTVGTYYMVELEVDNTPGGGSKIVRAYLDGVQFAGTTTSSDVGGNISGLALGGNLNSEAQTTGDWRFDDVAINDSSGSVQNGRVPAGQVIILRPNAAGDSNQWLDTAAAAGTTSNFGLVDETSPNDATDLVQSNTLSDTDLYNMGASGIGAGDTVNCIAGYLRRRNNVADAATAVAFVVRKTTGGTDGVGTAVVPNTTTWRTGNTTSATVLTPSYVAYVDPDGAAWTQATLDTMLAGCRITTGGTNRVQVSTVWVYVDYTAATSQTIAVGQATETDTSRPITLKLNRLAGLVTETDTARTITARKQATIGQASETDTARPITAIDPINAVVNLVTETDAAQAVAVDAGRLVNQATETDTALAIASDKIKLTGQVSETDTALAITVNQQQIEAVGQVTETDAARAVTAIDPIQRGIGQVSESDTSRALTAIDPHIVQVGRVSEVDTAQPITLDQGFVPDTFAANFETKTSSRWASSFLTNIDGRGDAPELDLDECVGQRQGTFKFNLLDGVTNQLIAEIHPVRDGSPSLSHDTSRTIKRMLSGITLTPNETELVNAGRHRIELYMVIGGVDFPLGRYIFTDFTRLLTTYGYWSTSTLVDEMFLVDRPLENTFSIAPGSVWQNVSESVDDAVRRLIAKIPIDAVIESSPYFSSGSWPQGARGGQVITDLSLFGDYMSPWFGNDKKMHLLRTFDPADVPADFDWDTRTVVIRDSIAVVEDYLSAPNRIVVVSNDAMGSTSIFSTPVVGSYDIRASAPHSAVNRGFIVQETINTQVGSVTQATAVAEALAQRTLNVERVEVSTPIDPRHDSYNVVRWDGSNWLELSWSMSLVEGGDMRHVLRKAYE